MDTLLDTAVAPSSVAPALGGPVRYGPELRVLVVGGGIAGLTLTALLEQRGFAPVVVEKQPAYDESGHVLGLWPAGSRILKGLHVFPSFLSAGVECSRYMVANEHGEILHSYSLTSLARKYGPLVTVPRSELVRVLRRAVGPQRIRSGVTVRDIVQTASGAVAVFDDGSSDVYDVIVGCDGIHSALRQMLFGDVALAYTGMTGWAFWLPSEFVPPPDVVEYWGAGKFFGMYPARDRVCVVAAVRAPANAPDPTESRMDRLRAHFAGFSGVVPWALEQIPRSQYIYHDDFSDLRLERWYSGRVVLIGDAAHPTLPTIGMGASLAMESAAVLAEELCRADSRHIGGALDQYVDRRRARVDRVQGHSRRLGRVMFAGNRAFARLRDGAVKMLADEQLLDVLDGMLGEKI